METKFSKQIPSQSVEIVTSDYESKSQDTDSQIFSEDDSNLMNAQMLSLSFAYFQTMELTVGLIP